VTPEAVEKMSELAAENKRLRADLEREREDSNRFAELRAKAENDNEQLKATIDAQRHELAVAWARLRQALEETT
jgi:hypothetical protein